MRHGRLGASRGVEPAQSREAPFARIPPVGQRRPADAQPKVRIHGALDGTGGVNVHGGGSSGSLDLTVALALALALALAPAVASTVASTGGVVSSTA